MSGRSSKHIHRPVMPREILRALELQPGQTIVDGTLGAAGHSVLILPEIEPHGTLLGIDRDPMMLALANKNLGEAHTTQTQVITKQGSYAQLGEFMEDENIATIDGIVVDLGLSSDQLADKNRGFGFDAGGPLDLRFDPSAGQPASEFLQTATTDEIVRVLRDYGEERHAQRIAERIVDGRRRRQIRTAHELVELVADAIPGTSGRSGKTQKHPATRVFQALRIHVNQELDQLVRALQTVFHNALRSGGRLVVLTFHSLEDRLVKDEFRRQERWKNLTTKPITATPAEVRANPRSRSAKLRIAQKL